MATVPGTSGDDFLFGTPEDDNVLGYDPAHPSDDIGADFLLGVGGNDSIDAAGGSDDLQGNDGDDTLAGGAGDDRLTGDNSFGDVIGADRLIGGAGADTFVSSVEPGRSSTSTVQDVVVDFEGAGAAPGDSLLLQDSRRHLVFAGALAALPAIGAALPGGGDGFTQVFYAPSGGATVVFADSDDDGVFDADDFALRLDGAQALTEADFGQTDFVVVGTGRDDEIDGGGSDDNIFGLGGADRLWGNGGADTLDGGGGADTLEGRAGNDRLIGGKGADELSGGPGRDQLLGGDGTDTLWAGADDDRTVAGGNGDDVLYGQEGDDEMDGDAGDDTLSGGEGDDVLFGEQGGDSISGDNGDDELFGDAGSDTLSGGSGEDELEGDAGGDRLEGGGGVDRFVFFLGAFNPSSTFRHPDTVVDFTGAGAPGGDLLQLRNEQLVFRGESSAAPALGAALPGARDGLVDLVYTVKDGDTWLLADENDNGRLDYGDTAIRFLGVHAFTVVDFEQTDFVTAGGPGPDALTGTGGDDTIFGLGGADTIRGEEGNDQLDGGPGRDSLDGGPGFDNLAGGDGADTLSLANSDFGGNASGGAGADLIRGSDAAFSLNTLEGDEGDDTLQGGAAGSAYLNGEDGDDRLVGGAGDDQFTGGAGVDALVFGSAWGSDIIWDFEDGVEKIDLRGSGLTFADLAIGDDGFSAIVTASAGRIEVSGMAGRIDASDFLFA